MMRPRMFSQPWLRTVALWGAVSMVQSVQTGTIAANNSTTTNTATISAVDTARTILFYLGSNAGANDASDFSARITLTNSTTVTATWALTTNSATYGFVAMELMPGLLRSLQYGAVGIADPAVTNTATITEVNTAKAAVMFLNTNYNTAGTQLRTYWSGRLTLTNGTTVTSTRNATQAGDSQNTGFVVLEWF